MTMLMASSQNKPARQRVNIGDHIFTEFKELKRRRKMTFEQMPVRQERVPVFYKKTAFASGNTETERARISGGLHINNCVANCGIKVPTPDLDLSPFLKHVA
jgi:hypothetical protein